MLSSADSNGESSRGENDLPKLEFRALWREFRKQPFAFWTISAYLFFEYVRPQSILPALDILPWMQIFLLLSAVGLLVRGGNRTVARTYVLFWLIVFQVVIILSGFTAFVPAIAWLSLDSYYLWVIIFFLITQIVTTDRQLFLLLGIYFIANLKMSVFGAQVWALRGFSFTSWGIRGPPGYFGNSGEYAIEMTVFFAFSMYFFFAFRDRLAGWKYWIAFAAPITAAMSVMGASSRGSQIALVVLLYLIFLHGKISLKAIFLSCIIGALVYHLLPDEQLARFQDIGEDKTSEQRLLYWENGWEMMKDYPTLGVGFFNFIPYFEAYYSQDMLYDEAQLAHNIFVQVGADLGFTGLFVYLILIWLGFSVPAKARKRLTELGLEKDWRVFLSKGMALGFLGFIIAGQFVSVVYYPFMFIHLSFSCVLLNTVETTRRGIIERSSSK